MYEYPLVVLALAAIVKAWAQLTNGTQTPGVGAVWPVTPAQLPIAGR